MNQRVVVRRVVAEALATGVPAHEVADGVLRRAGVRVTPVVSRALAALRAGDLEGGLRGLGCGPLEVKVIAADPSAAARVEDRLARLPSWVTFVQELGGSAVYGLLLLAVTATSAFAAVRVIGAAELSAGPALTPMMLSAALAVVLVEAVLILRPWRSLQLARAVAAAAACAGSGSSTTPALSIVDGVSGGRLSKRLGSFERLDASALDQLEAVLVAEYEHEAGRASEAMRVLGLAIAGLPAVDVLVRTYGVVGTIADWGLR